MVGRLTDHEEGDGEVVAAGGPEGAQQGPGAGADQPDDADPEDGPAHRRRAQAAALLRHRVPATSEKTRPPYSDPLTHTLCLSRLSLCLSFNAHDSSYSA